MYNNWEVNDLKKLLKSRGLSVAGVKQDLIDRLQSSEAAAEALLEESEAGEDGFDEELDKELDESALMADEEHTEEITRRENDNKNDQKENNAEISKSNEDAAPPASPKKVEDSKDTTKTEKNGSNDIVSQASKQVKLSLKSQPLVLSEADKKKARAERFGIGEKNQTSALAKRAERFSLNKNSTSKAADSSTGLTKVSSTTTNEVLKRRAERFGILSPVELKRQHLEKLQARKLRFQQASITSPEKGKVTTANSTTTSTSAITSASSTTTTTTTNGTKVASSLSIEERKKLRAERFKIASS
ncbi:hypothetical protein O3M35_001491 [Rhynocoris fuscipes]|uniref:SAP domain-containing protein n=1 Tax=Rhynocoris fuscipes TaxID=488301 RepID=A0AAW1CPC7_9HEMI